MSTKSSLQENSRYSYSSLSYCCGDSSSFLISAAITMFSGSVSLLSAPEYEENAISSHVQDLILIPSLHAVDGGLARSGLVSLRMAQNTKKR